MALVYTSSDIARQLGLSTRTVETHIRNACLKFGVRNKRLLGKALAAQGVIFLGEEHED